MPTLQTYQGVYLWKYVPSLPLSVIFFSLFTIVTAFHCWRLYKTKALFTIPFIVGGFCEFRRAFLAKMTCETFMNIC